MDEWLWLTLDWLAVAVAISPIVIGISWGVVEGSVMPRLVPCAEIDAMTDAVMRDHSDDPEGWAFLEERAEWFRSHVVEQGKWRRVRKTIRRRIMAGEWPPFD